MRAGLAGVRWACWLDLLSCGQAFSCIVSLERAVRARRVQGTKQSLEQVCENAGP